MTIAKADILTEVKNRLNRPSLADIDSELLTIMQEVATLVPGILQKTDTCTIAASGYNIALPTGVIYPVAVTDSNGIPLTKKSFQHVISKLRSDVATATAEIYAFFAKKIYVHPKVKAETVLTVYFNHDDSNVNSIALPDEADEALIEGVCHKIQLSKGLLNELPPGTITHHNFYQAQIEYLKTRYRMYSE